MRSAFGIVGGDKRQIWLARLLEADGHLVYVSGLEAAPEAGRLNQVSQERLAAGCDLVILPLPATRDGMNLNAPLSHEGIPLDDSFARQFSGKRVLAGMPGKLMATSAMWQEIDCRDYYAQEELVTGNAFLTAEGAIGLAIREYEGTLGGSRCLVTGFGRIGKALCRMLKGMGAQVYCAARKASDRAAIRATGSYPLDYGQLAQPFDLIINTVPSLVLEEAMLACQSPDALLMELASAPGGIDLPAAERLGLRVLNAPSLPGRMSPKAAAELIKESIYHILDESATK